MNVSNGPRLGVLDGAGHGPPVHDWLGWAEAVAACASLGVDPPRRLGFPDGAVADHEDAGTESLSEALAPDEVCLATWRADGHPDHEATGRAGRTSVRAYRSQARGVPRLDVALGRASRPGRFVAAGAPPPAATPGAGAEHAAVQCHRSQLDPPAPGADPVLPPFVVDRLVTDQEMLLP